MALILMDILYRQCSFVFESFQKPSNPGGAILVLPEGYTKGTILSGVIHDINIYLQDHVESWYAPTNHWNSDNNLANGALKLIYSCYKTPIWGAGVLPRDKYHPDIPAVKMECLAFGELYRWNAAENPIRVNHGSTKRNGSDICYTIAIEVFSVIRSLERTKKGFFSSLSLKSIKSLSIPSMFNHTSNRFLNK